MKTSSRSYEGTFWVTPVCILFFVFFLALFHTGCTSLELKSQWKDREIVIDGKSKDWLGALYYFEDENISAGFFNDEDNLYVCIIAEAQVMRAQVMMQGLTVWFDPDGGKKKTFGIRYPLMDRETMMRLREEGESREGMQEHFQESLTEMEILGPREGARKQIKIQDAKGTEISLEASSGMLVYELKVPLVRTEHHPNFLLADPGDRIGMGLEIPKPDMNALRQKMGGPPPGGGVPPGGSRGGFGGRPGGGRGMSQFPGGLKVWIILQLASAGE